MTVPTSFSDLSTTAASNSPAGGDAVLPSLDDYLRFIYAALASIYANTSTNGWVSPYLPKSGPTVTGALTLGASGISGKAWTPTQSVTFSATPTFDASLGNVFELGTLTGNVTTCTISNATAGQTIMIRVKQDGTGGRTFASPSGAKILGSLSTVANGVSILTLTYSSADTRWEGAWTPIGA